MQFQENVSWAIDSAVWASGEDDFGDEQADERLNVGRFAFEGENFALAVEPDRTMPLIASR